LGHPKPIFSLSGNALNGTIGKAIGNANELVSLTIGNNQLGQLPTQLGLLSNLELADLSGNLFTGNIPFCSSPGMFTILAVWVFDAHRTIRTNHI